VPSRKLLPLAIASMLASVWLACADDECTEIGCYDQSIVSLPVGLVQGPYDLEITGTPTPLQARCLQPAAPEAAENSPELECDGSTFEINVAPGTSVREIQVTITDVDTEEVLAANVVVQLDAVDESAPNGPDCPPICFVRNGALVVPGVD
jgi:hypothetical protein